MDPVDEAPRDAPPQARLGLLIGIVVLAILATLAVDAFRPDKVPTSMPCVLGDKSKSGELRCTFDDEFSGSKLDTSKWLVQKTADSGYHSGSECFVDSPDNVSVSGGHLSLTVLNVGTPFTCSDTAAGYPTLYTSGSVTTWKRFSQTYGRFEIRAKFPAAKVAGLQSALWLYPQKLNYGAWPNSGEIDIAEAYSRYPDRAIPYLHYTQTSPDATVTNNRCKVKDVSEFHIYAAVWTRKSITITYDGKTCLVHTWNPAPPLTSPAPFDQPFLVALTQALGITDNTFNPQKTPLPATTQVDYVRVWS